MNTIYSLRFHIRSRLEQRHGHQSITLTSIFYKNNRIGNHNIAYLKIIGLPKSDLVIAIA
jgi:hypothetical protein